MDSEYWLHDRYPFPHLRDYNPTLIRVMPRLIECYQKLLKESGPLSPPGQRPADGFCTSAWHGLIKFLPNESEREQDKVYPTGSRKVRILETISLLEKLLETFNSLHEIEELETLKRAEAPQEGAFALLWRLHAHLNDLGQLTWFPEYYLRPDLLTWIGLPSPKTLITSDTLATTEATSLSCEGAGLPAIISMYVKPDAAGKQVEQIRFAFTAERYRGPAWLDEPENEPPETDSNWLIDAKTVYEALNQWGKGNLNNLNTAFPGYPEEVTLGTLRFYQQRLDYVSKKATTISNVSDACKKLNKNLEKGKYQYATSHKTFVANWTPPPNSHDELRNFYCLTLDVFDCQVRGSLLAMQGSVHVSSYGRPT